MPGKTKATIALLLLLVITVGFLHTFTPADKLVLHDLYRRLSYLPIVAAAILYGIRGGVLLAAATSVAFIPHLQHFYHLGPTAYLSELPEIFLYFGAGIVTGAIAAKEKQLRIKYQELAEQLEGSYKKLHSQAATLVEAEEQLHASQKLSALGQLSASLAHEVKNPLAGIRGAAEILADDFPKNHPKHEFSQILLKETSRLSTTVEEILRYSRQQQPDSTSPRLEALPSVLERVVSLLDNNFCQKNITISIELTENANEIQIDGDKMSQVFINLLLNSCEAIASNGKITISNQTNDTGQEIHFQDNGPGIAADEQTKIFEPFYTTGSNGTGLGLAISSRIVESYGGTLRAKTPDKGSGALFVITLPQSNSGA